MRRRTGSISLPIVLGSTTVALAIALLVGWTLVILQNLELTKQVVQNTWLLVAGVTSLGVIISVLVVLSVFLVRAILEVRRQTSFIDSVTHELKSPLAELRLCLDTLVRPELRDDQREQLRETMVGAVDRLSVFIDDILEASRLAHGRRGHALADVDIASLARRCAEVIAARHKIAADAITVDVPAGLSLLTDPMALETVLKNLLDNAVKYSNQPVRVEVRARATAGGLFVEVRDRGIGVPKPHLGRIFERFYRVPAEEVSSRHGTGLGLFVVSALVRHLGGSIQAQSEGPGRGTSMRVSLPAGPRPHGASA